MKKMILVAAAMSMLLLNAVTATALSADLKIGYVDLQKAIQQTKDGKAAKKKLEAEVKKKKESLAKAETDLKTKQEDIQKKKDILSNQALQQKAAEIQQEMLKYRENLAKSQMELQKKERELMEPILNKMTKVIQSLAEEKKYDMILEKSQQGIVWAKKNMDLTADLVTKFEKLKK